MWFVLFRYMKLENEAQFHGNDFEWILTGFTISTGSINYSSGNIIYIVPNSKAPAGNNCLKDVPNECFGTGAQSIKCFAKIKEKGYGYYNGAFFKPSDRWCR